MANGKFSSKLLRSHSAATAAAATPLVTTTSNGSAASEIPQSNINSGCHESQSGHLLSIAINGHVFRSQSCADSFRRRHCVCRLQLSSCGPQHLWLRGRGQHHRLREPGGWKTTSAMDFSKILSKLNSVSFLLEKQARIVVCNRRGGARRNYYL